MSENYPELRKELGAAISEIRKGLPELMKGSAELHKAAYSEGALSAKTKELIALAVGIAVRCDGCIAFHSNGVLRQGATRQEVLEAIGVAIQMGGGPSTIYGAQALQAYDQFSSK